MIRGGSGLDRYRSADQLDRRADVTGLKSEAAEHVKCAGMIGDVTRIGGRFLGLGQPTGLVISHGDS